MEIESVQPEIPLCEVCRRFGNSGYVVDSVPLALLGAQRVLTLGFREMVFDLISGGGDTDTIASIAGQVAGTLIGKGNLPDEMLTRVIDLDFIDKVANEFATCIGGHYPNWRKLQSHL